MIDTPNMISAAAPTAAVAAPPPQYVPVDMVAPMPAPGYTWVDGEWVWNNGWYWSAGYWAVPPIAGTIWIGGYWDHGRYFRGHWGPRR